MLNISRAIPLDVCKLAEANDEEVARTVKYVELKKAKVQNQSTKLGSHVVKLQRENLLLDKQIIYTKSLNLTKQKEIDALKKKVIEASCTLKQTLWKLFKTEHLKEFEAENNEEVIKSKFKYEQSIENTDSKNLNNNSDEVNYESWTNKSTDELEVLEERIYQLKEEISKRTKMIQTWDPRLSDDIEMLEKRNAVLLVRYQRQLQEAESRYRQALSELNSLHKLADTFSLNKTDV